MQNNQDYLKQATSVHNKIIQHLANNGDTPSLELAAIFENAANLYLDISDHILEEIKKQKAGL